FSTKNRAARRAACGRSKVTGWTGRCLAMAATSRLPDGAAASPSARWGLCNSRDLPRGVQDESGLAVGSPMGHGWGAICGGGRCGKIFWCLWMILGKSCRQTATVDRMDSVINQLTVTREDILAAAERIAGQVVTTPLVATSVRGARI